MCTIIKVKRKIDEDPAECLIIECKKKRIFVNDEKLNTNNQVNASDSIKQILKYAGSAQSENEIPARILELSNKIETRKSPNLKVNLKSQLSNGSKKDAPSAKSFSYVMIGKKRGLEELNNEVQKPIEDSQENINNKNDSANISVDNKKIKVSSNLNNVNIIDVISSEYFNNQMKNDEEPTKKVERSEEKIVCNGVEMIREKVDTTNETKEKDKYIYDIYYTKNSDIHLDLLYPNNFEIKSYNIYNSVDLVDDNQDDDEDLYNADDDEDSNDEGNWRNDYPDEDEYDIDEENDEVPYYSKNNFRHNQNPYVDGHENEEDEDYDEYSYGYADDNDDYETSKLSSYMKKSCKIDRSYYEDDENDDFDEYVNDDVGESYTAYKKRILKEFAKKQSDSD